MKCPKCRKDREFKEAIFERIVRVPPVRFIVETPAKRCPSCKTYVLTEAHVQDAELEVAGKIATTGPVSSASFRLLRSAARLRSVELARLLGVTKETISRWESGKRSVEPLAWRILSWIVLERRDGRATTRHLLDSFLLAKPLRGTVRLAVRKREEAAIDLDAETAAEQPLAYVLTNRDE